MPDQTPTVRVDGYEKVTGRAKYGADLTFDRMLFGRVLRPPHAHARVLSIDVSRARALPGVRAVLTAADIPGEPAFGAIVKDHYVLVTDRVRYRGDGVAIVAADSEELAEQALDLIEVRYEALPGLYDPRDAARPDAPRLYPENGDNLVVHYPVRKGDVAAGFAQSDVVLEREYQTQFIEHAYLEPEAVVALPDEGQDTYRVHGSFQNPNTARADVARTLGVPLNAVRVIQAHLGGSFGGKDDGVSVLAARAALLARVTQRPVKMVYSREESIIESYKRHPYFMKYKIGATRDGRIQAMQIDLVADSGAYASMSAFVTWRSVVQATGPYEVPNVQTDIRAYYTNNVYTGAMRGFGSPQVIFANESLMDELAEELGMSPLELRRINALRQGSVTATNQTLDGHTVAALEVMDKATGAAEYEAKRAAFAAHNATGSHLKRGIGFAVSYRGCSLGAEGTDATSAIVSVQRDGSAFVLTGLAENGQGLKTTFAMVAARVLGLPLSRFRFQEPDTNYIADGGGTVASRSTLTGGAAVQDAATIVRDRIAAVVYGELGAEVATDLVFADARVSCPASGRFLSFEDALQRCVQAGENLTAYGTFNGPHVDWDEPTGQGNAYFTYVYGCQVAEVEVDLDTGKVNVLRVVAAHDVGHAVNRQGVLGQIYGGVTQGMGYGVLERVESEEGRITNTNLDEYILPTSLEIGEIVPIIVENPDKYGPWGGKSIGEPTLELTAPAIANAVAQALGRRIRRLPLDLETVFLGHPLTRGSAKRGSEQ